MTSAARVARGWAKKICLRHSHLCARVTVKDYKLSGVLFKGPLAASPSRNNSPRTSGSSALVVLPARSRGNERVLQFALDAIIALLGLNKLFRFELCAGARRCRKRREEGMISSDTRRGGESFRRFTFALVEIGLDRRL